MLTPRFLLLLSVLALLCSAATSGPEFPEHHAAAPQSPEVTAGNLAVSERFWPYQVALLRPWQPASAAQPLGAGATGVLIRVEASGDARIDFGRDGLFTVPLAQTDLLERANDVRLGVAEKVASNLVLALGPRLVDSAAETIRPLRIAEAARHSGFLTVFARPVQFAALAPVLAPLNGRAGVLTIVLPQGRQSDPEVRDVLRKLGWKVPFVREQLAEGYTESLLPEGLELPAVMLQTPEGRVLFQGTWGPDVAAQLTAAIDAGFTAAAAK